MPDGAEAMRNGIFVINDATHSGDWSLRPYVDKAEPRAVEDFMLCMEFALKWPRNSFRKRMADKATRRVVLRKHMRELSRAYGFAFGDKNLTSMSLYSGPFAPSKAGAVTFTPGLDGLACAKVGWLGTGDADLRNPAHARAFERHFRNELPYVSTFVLPHHGSIHNNAPDHLISDAENWVVSAEPVHRHWQHPAPELANAVAKVGTLRHVKRDPVTGFGEVMLIYSASCTH